MSIREQCEEKSRMSGLVKAFLDWLRGLFWKEEMELTLVGLQNSGKTTLVNVLAVSFFTLSFFVPPRRLPDKIFFFFRLFLDPRFFRTETSQRT